MYASFIFHTRIDINCKKCIVVAILIFSHLTPIYMPKNYWKRSCPGFDPVTPLVYQSPNLTCSKFRFQSSKFVLINSNLPFACVNSSIWYSPFSFWLCSFAIIVSYCFTSEIQELMFLSQTLTTSWHLIQFPVAYLRRPFR